MTENKYVAVDLDGCIAEYDGWKGEEHIGEPKEFSQSALKMLDQMGFKIIIYTCRRNTEIVKEYLEENNLNYDYINENPEQPETARDKKIFAHYYIDDRNVFFTSIKHSVLAISNNDPPTPLKCPNCGDYDICRTIVNADERMEANGCSGYYPKESDMLGKRRDEDD